MRARLARYRLLAITLLALAALSGGVSNVTSGPADRLAGDCPPTGCGVNHNEVLLG
jgi:hypothetical protein